VILSHQTACSGQCAHDRAVELSSPRNLCVLSVSALDSSFFEASRIAKSNLLIFFRTLLHSSKSQLLSFQANPNSFPKTPGGGVPPPPLSAFVPCVLCDLCGEIFFCSVLSPSFSTRFKNEPDKDSPAIRLSTSLFFGKLSLAGKSKVHAFARRSTLLRGPGSKR
jgi:hypothetical protein